jgi:hypothetical protein
METAPTGFAAHVAAEQAIHDRMAEADRQAAHDAALEQLRFSPEVQQLNSMAEVEIWGTHGHTRSYHNPATGEPLTEPVKGLVNEMRENRRYGTTQAEREDKARAYEDDIQKLQDEEGLELCQAKLVMDMRQEDDAAWALMTGKRIAEGKDPQEAWTEIGHRYMKKDAWRLKHIKEQGIFTADGWAHRSRSANPGQDDPTAVLGGGTVEADGWNDAFPELEARSRSLEGARAEYVRLSAGRSGKAFRIGKEFSEESVSDAREQYEEEKQELIEYEIDMLREAGFTDDELADAGYVRKGAILEANRLATDTSIQRLINTGKYEWKDIHDPATGETRHRLVRESPPSTVRGDIKKLFRGWWGTKGGDKLFSRSNAKVIAKRAAVVGAIPAAVAGAYISMPITLGVAGAMAANKTAGKLLNFRPGKRDGRGRDELWIDQARHESLAAIQDLERRGSTLADLDIADQIDEQTEARIAGNRKRRAIQLGATALGAVGGGVGGTFVKY